MRKILNSFLIFTILTTLFVANSVFAESKSFNDLNQNHWAYANIQSMVNSGILDGYNDGSFKPEKSVTREEFAKMIVNSFGLDPIITDKSSFFDIQKERWSKPYIEAAKEYITYNAIKDGRSMFNPEGLALREDVAVAIVKALKLDPTPSNYNAVSKFRDIKNVSPQIINYIAVAVENNLIVGFEDGTFRGDKPLTRAEVATILSRATKTAGTSGLNEPLLEIISFETLDDVPGSKSIGVVYFSGKVHLGATVTADGRKLATQENGLFYGTYRYDTSGEKTVIFKANNGIGITQTITKTIYVNMNTKGAPLNADETFATIDIPEVVDKNEVKVTIKTDAKNEIWIEGMKVNQSNDEGTVRYNWTNLSEGINMKDVMIKTRNGDSKQYTIKTTFSPIASQFSVELPTTSSLPSVVAAIDLTQMTNNYGFNISLTVNGAVYRIDSMTPRYTLYLTPGDNLFSFEVTNQYGKMSKIDKTVKYVSQEPQIAITSYPKVVSGNSTTITGYVDRDGDLTVNGNSVILNSKQFEVRVNLNNSKNNFEFKFRDKFGVQSTKLITIEKN